MSSLLKRIIYYISRMILVLLAITGILLVYFTITEYKPPLKESLGISRHVVPESIVKNNISLLIWNVGYCGLGEEMDFFYEGGSKMRPDITNYQNCLNSIHTDLLLFGTADFILLQEVDKLARRSYYVNQKKIFADAFIDKESVYAINYNVPYVPLPILNPMARVKSGMQVFASYKILQAYRYDFPINYAWPLKLFMLDRCYIYTSFQVSNGKKLVILNIHNSAFDDADELRELELLMIKARMLEEYEKGNYVIAGGDWNQNPPDFDPKLSDSLYNVKTVNSSIDKDYFPYGWQWVFDPQYPTNRNVNTPYVKGETPTTVIDFFIVSPNIIVDSIQTLVSDFSFTDHHPVWLNVTLKMDNDSIH